MKNLFKAKAKIQTMVSSTTITTKDSGTQVRISSYFVTFQLSKDQTKCYTYNLAIDKLKSPCLKMVWFIINCDEPDLL